MSSTIKPASMNIKNSRAVDLSKQLAALTGESLTTAITVAVEERLVRLQREADAEAKCQRITALAHEIATLLGPEFREVDHGDLLYDEMGLPK